MTGDFSRSTFDPHKHYQSVRLQQGRVQLDSDWNEQSDILEHQRGMSLDDTVGCVGMPEPATPEEFGFKIDIEDAPPLEHVNHQGHHPPVPDFAFSPGRAYVDGILCENEGILLRDEHVRPMRFSEQLDFPGARDPLAEKTDAYIVYIDTWPRFVTALQDPEILEAALGGVDTTARQKNICQVKLWPAHRHHEHPHDADEKDAGAELREWSTIAHEHPEIATLRNWQEFRRRHTPNGRMAIVKPAKAWTLGNQLYRVEIHSGDHDGLPATIKWSRENGSVAFGIAGVKPRTAAAASGTDQSPAPAPAAESPLTAAPREFTLTLKYLARARSQIEPDNWIEIADDESTLNGKAWPLCRVLAVHLDQETIEIQVSSPVLAKHLSEWAQHLPASHPLVRRWDHPFSADYAGNDGAIPLEPGKAIDLEKDLKVIFHGAGYLSGDYWLVPTRVGEGPSWPRDPSGNFPSRPPDGVTHHYAPIALLFRNEHRWHVKQRRALFLPLTALTTRVKHTEHELVETRKSLEEKIERTREDLEGRIERTRGELTEKIERSHWELDHEIKRSHAELEHEIKRSHTELEHEFKRSHAELEHEFKRSHAELEHEFKKVVAELRITQVSLGRVMDILHRWGAGPRRARVLEYFMSPQHLDVGDVVALMPGELECVQRCTRENRSQVVGVVIGEPVRMAEIAEGDDQEKLSDRKYEDTLRATMPVETKEFAFHERRYPVAISGKARCQVIGPVGPGDLLTPSHVPGCARRVPFLPWPGTIVGKALQGHDGRDVSRKAAIEILVTLA